ncbi:MAG: hypothetical protein HY819_00940 [Acidobacteria bacterium]|nr:hypothetical protein [Acidobacteriota bacterium]
MYYPNATLKIKRASFAKRCEICHQVDCFDREKNYCSRCQQIFFDRVNPQIKQNNKITISRVSYLVYLLLNLFITTVSYWLLQTFHPFLARESSSLFFFPMTLITACLFPLNYRYLISKARVGRKIFVFYSTFLIALFLYGIYLCFYIQFPNINLRQTLEGFLFIEFLSLATGHIFGLPTLIFMIFINYILRNFLFRENQKK